VLLSLMFLCILLVILILIYFSIYLSSLSFTLNKAITGHDKSSGLQAVDDFLILSFFFNFLNLFIATGGTYNKHCALTLRRLMSYIYMEHHS